SALEGESPLSEGLCMRKNLASISFYRRILRKNLKNLALKARTLHSAGASFRAERTSAGSAG
ncbi:hypothetical protein M8745_20020, partial [Lutimaribacter sp. EGI FJ00014]|nr:hypothetical protein [Lutimaribacter sp. EGI FJ00014]